MAKTTDKKDENTWPDLVIFQQQGPSAFLKVKMDWARIGKLHLSFVKHDGRKNGCNQIAHIEAALDLFGGPGKENAHYLAEAIKNGYLEHLRGASIRAKLEAKSQYCEPIFVSNGGSPAKPESNRPCMWRVVTISPGLKTDYAISVSEAEGVVNSMGGFSKKEGAPITRIDVGMSREELLALAGVISSASACYMSYKIGPNAFTPAQNTGKQAAPAAQQPASAPPPTSVAPKDTQEGRPKFCWVVYDTLGENFTVAMSANMTIQQVQEIITSLRKNNGFSRRDNTEYEAVKASVLGGKAVPNESLCINLYKGQDECQVIVMMLECKY